MAVDDKIRCPVCDGVIDADEEEIDEGDAWITIMLNCGSVPPAFEPMTGGPVSEYTGAAVNAPVGLKRNARIEKLPFAM